MILHLRDDCGLVPACEFLEGGDLQCDVDARGEHVAGAGQEVGAVVLVRVHVQPGE